MSEKFKNIDLKKIIAVTCGITIAIATIYIYYYRAKTYKGDYQKETFYSRHFDTAKEIMDYKRAVEESYKENIDFNRIEEFNGFYKLINNYSEYIELIGNANFCEKYYNLQYDNEFFKNNSLVYIDILRDICWSGGDSRLISVNEKSSSTNITMCIYEYKIPVNNVRVDEDSYFIPVSKDVDTVNIKCRTCTEEQLFRIKLLIFISIVILLVLLFNRVKKNKLARIAGIIIFAVIIFLVFAYVIIFVR